MDIILYLLQTIQQLYKQNCWLFNFICRYIPLKQWAFDDSHSPKYQKLKIDKLPRITNQRQDWDYKDLIGYYKKHYGKTLKPFSRRVEFDAPDDITCPCCNAPKPYLAWNDGKKKTQVWCKVCNSHFSPTDNNRFFKGLQLRCPHCNHVLVPKKTRKHFVVHKCVNPKCPYYVRNLKKVEKKDLAEDYGKNKYKLHYIYREYNLDFFKVDLRSIPKNASSLKFNKFSSNVVSLALTYHINLGLSLRKTSEALKMIHGISISHQQIANYCRTAAMCIKPFVDNYDYKVSDTLTADETYIKIRGVKAFVWLIMDAASRTIVGYRTSLDRSVGPCILAMRMAFRNFKDGLPEKFRFIADGYSAYPLAAQQFLREYGDKFKFSVTQVLGLTNDDEVSKEFRPYKQIVERLNRTYKASYRHTCGFDGLNGASYDLALWVAYYNFLRPHTAKGCNMLNEIIPGQAIENMPRQWQLLICLGQQKIINLQKQQTS